MNPVVTISPLGPRWYSIPARVLLLTFIFALLTFAIGLLIGICAVLVQANLHSVHPDLRFAYRDIAAPAAGVVAAITVVSATFMELRHYRQAKALSHIERQIQRAG